MAGAPRTEVGAATVPLAPRPAAKPFGATVKHRVGATTAALPKATVKLKAGPNTMPLAGKPGMASPSTTQVKRDTEKDPEQFYEDKDPEAGLVPISIGCLLASLALLAVQMLSTDSLTTSPPNQPSGFMIPAVERVEWETMDAAGTWRNNFDKLLPQIPN